MKFLFYNIKSFFFFTLIPYNSAVTRKFKVILFQSIIIKKKKPHSNVTGIHLVA